jgi:hypothetical protein
VGRGVSPLTELQDPVGEEGDSERAGVEGASALALPARERTVQQLQLLPWRHSQEGDAVGDEGDQLSLSTALARGKLTGSRLGASRRLGSELSKVGDAVLEHFRLWSFWSLFLDQLPAPKQVPARSASIHSPSVSLAAQSHLPWTARVLRRSLQ